MHNDTPFSKALGHRILKNETGKRVSEDAAIHLLKALEQRGKELAEAADEMADHADRKTIQEEDMRKAIYNGSEDR